MSTERATETATGQKRHKVLNLYGGQIDAYQRARAFALVACGRGATEGELVEEIATGYVEQLHNPEADCGNHTIQSMVSETAADTGDPTFRFGELKTTHGNVLDKLASHANTDSIDGYSTSMEIMAYYSCPAKNGGTE